jgi:hypothetical protein
MKDRDGHEIKEGDVYFWHVTKICYVIEKGHNGYYQNGLRFRNQLTGNLSHLKVTEKNIFQMCRVVKGAYIWRILESKLGRIDNGDVAGFDCPECGYAKIMMLDPVEEQPNYCFNCGVKFDWRGVYEEMEEE